MPSYIWIRFLIKILYKNGFRPDFAFSKSSRAQTELSSWYFPSPSCCSSSMLPNDSWPGLSVAKYFPRFKNLSVWFIIINSSSSVTNLRIRAILIIEFLQISNFSWIYVTWWLVNDGPYKGLCYIIIHYTPKHLSSTPLILSHYSLLFLHSIFSYKI